ncbi:Transposase-like protein [Mycena sanguinolenta]|uniref:Transposase-like protein n=1 Tax=Mycena sanguinolenta TaxID=230812 RepID=A0A8H7CRX4_9AGAR|nr:Transposase-like protein [Mycena sanguinolenta]
MTGTGILVLVTQVESANQTVNIGATIDALNVFLALTLATNIVSTGLISFRIIKINRDVASMVSSNHSPARSASMRILSVIVESAAIYTSLLTAILIANRYDAFVTFALIDCTPPTIGLVFSYIIIRVSRGTSYESTVQTIPASTLRLRNHTYELDQSLSTRPGPRHEVQVRIHSERTQATTEGASKEDLTIGNTPYYLWASLLDPRIGYTMLKHQFADDPGLLFDLEESKKALRPEYETQYAPKRLVTPAVASMSTTMPAPARCPNKSPKKSFADRLWSQQTISVSQQDELQRYFDMTSTPLPIKDTDILAWWYGSRALFPNLYEMARDIHCIPGSAVAVEQVFSGARDTIALRRARLSANTIRTPMVLKAHIPLVRKEVIDILDEVDNIELQNSLNN